MGRDCTALFESYHLRPDVAVAMLKRLPTLPDFPVDAVPRSPYPNDSEFYNTVRWGRQEGKAISMLGAPWPIKA